MTLKEKAQLLVGTGMYFELPEGVQSPFGDQEAVDPQDSAYSAMVNHIRTFVPGAAGNTSMFNEKGITTQVLADGPAGLRIQPKRKGEERTYYCTAFPIATVLASTWDTALVNNVGQAMGNEVLEYGVDVLLAPGMNLQRDPLCGRNFEYYSEDPLVTGKMAAAMVKGVQSNGVGTSIKHFAVNNQETNRMSVDAIVSQRALRELYLKGFEIAVKEAQPWTVMSSYNKVNGTYASESHDLLTKILRDDWGFEGYVMTDWGGGSDVVAQMKAGNDMIQPGSPDQIHSLIKAVEEGQLEESVLNKNVGRILRIMLKSPKYNDFKYSSNPDLKTHAKVTRQAAADGMVLLENNGILPLAASIKKVAAFGNSSYDFISGGTGSGDVNEAYTVSLIQGLKNGGYETNAALMKSYENYLVEARANAPKPKNWLTAMMGGKTPVAEMIVSKELAAQMAQENDIALITIGRNSGEGGDREPLPGDFYLTDVEMEMVLNVTEAFHLLGKQVVVVLNVGGVIETASWKNIPDAVLLAWQPGQEGGNSVVDVLSGKVNPSGKLAITFPLKYKDGSSSNTFPGHEVEGETGNEADLSGFSFMNRVPWESTYNEDIYVGYRYYNTFDIAVSYPFGHGKSYTTFEYSNVTINKDKFNEKVTVSAMVKNTGGLAGREVVQVYLTAPGKSMDKPTDVLVDFGKTRLLKPGEEEALTFEIEAIDLCSFDEDRSAWVAEAGKYEVKIAASAKDVQGTVGFELPGELVVETVSNALAPAMEINKLKK
ncbi:glycoside hydrolase family 3 protein [Marinilabilia sp.]|uniref:beta-glucosidase n=1 Tax=Marinilabilia sp. TaxID=2021252 RepID=UPI0025BB1D73|nr:glycoside hydrolase family 3 protein [Marinilabilia sp.]